MISLTTARDVQLLLIIARAASPGERANAEWFEPSSDQRPGIVEERARLWAATVAGGDQGQFESYLKVRKLTGRTFVRALSDVTVKDPGKLPGWAYVLIEIMDSFDTIANDEAAPSLLPWMSPSNPFDDLLRPLVRLGAGSLQEKIRGLHLSVSSRAEEGILEVLVRRLASAIIHVVDHEAQTLLGTEQLMAQLGLPSPRNLDGTLDGWLARLDRYPVLARVIAVVFGNWRGFAFEFLERLADDRKLLQDTMFSGEAPGRLDGFEGDAGDLHDHGRAVALLQFDSGHRLVYKPKDLRISAAFLDIVSLLNKSGLQIPLHVRKMILRGPYAWEEWVEHAPCQSEAQVEKFYFRMGMVTRLLQLLGARDFWLDNLVACGEYPVFIDLEMSLQHMPKLPDILAPFEQTAYLKLQETSVPIGIIAMNTPIGEGMKAEDLGALTPLREFQTPFRFSYSSSIRELLAPDLKKNDHTKWNKTEYAPFLNGKPVAAALHFERVLEGYRAMHDCLSANQAMLLAEDSPLHTIGDAPLRHIHRDTWTCLRIINDSTRTPLLVDGFNRELFFEGLMKVALDSDPPDNDPPDGKLIRMIENEIAAFRDLDVPLFLTPASKTAVLLRDGGAVEEYFSKSSLECVFDRVRMLDDFDVDEQCDFIRSTFASGPHQSPRRSFGARSISPPSRDVWLNRAVELGDFILRQAVRDSKGQLTWLGLIYHPDCDLRAMDVLRPDLLSGTCGLAVLFADLYRATAIDRFQAAARGAMASTTHAIEGRHPIVKMAELASSSTTRFIACGAYYGVGSQIYAVRRCAQALNCDALKELAHSYLRMLPIPSLLKHAHLDVISGLSGLLLSVLPFQNEPATASSIEVIRAVAGEILDVCQHHPDSLVSPNPEGADFLKGLPNVVSGCILALSRYHLSAQDQSQPIDCAIDSAIRLLEQRIPAGIADKPSVWANLYACNLRGGEDLLDGVNQQLASPSDSWSTLRILDLLEIVFAALRTTGDQKYHDIAIGLAQELVHRHESCGSWFPDSYAADRHNLSAMHGVGAIASYFLGLYDADRFRSIRALE